MLKVKTLIQLLSKMPPDALVFISSNAANTRSGLKVTYQVSETKTTMLSIPLNREVQNA
jgi:hypothetical protein